MHETDGEREHRSQQKDADDRVAELIGQQFPYRIVLRRRNDIVAVLPSALGDLVRRQTPGIVTDHVCQNLLFRENCRVDASSRTAMNNRIVKAMSDEPP